MSTEPRADRQQVTREELRKDARAGEETAAERATDLAELPAGVRAVVEALEEHKGIEPLVLDLRGLASFADAMVICSGRAERHVQALADAVTDRLREEGNRPLHTEGYEQATWILIDFVDFLVNVFTPETRDYYQLDRLWRDAPVALGTRPERGSGPGETVDPAAHRDDADGGGS